MRAMTWAIRVTFPNGRDAFLRRGARPGMGPIVTFYSKAKADAEAAFLREGLDAGSVITVIERSHGRRDLPPRPDSRVTPAQDRPRGR